jgi:hypothetical protein
MKKLFKNKWLTIALLLFTLSTVSVVAQPSIPRRGQRATRGYNRPQRNSRVAWGTQYDWLSQRRATYRDIQYKDRGQVRVLLNSIYARHGRYFRDPNLSDYFYSQPWYRPFRNEVPTSSFNSIEKYNINFLSKYD